MQEAEEELLEQLMESDHKPVSWDHIGQLHYVSNSTSFMVTKFWKKRI